MKPGEIKIFNALVNAESGLKFTELRKLAELSSPVLSEYLAKMQKQGVVWKEPKTRRYALAKIYYPAEAFSTEFQKALKFFAGIAVKAASEISQIKEKEVKEEAFRGFLNCTFYFFMVLVWKIIGEAIGVFGNEMENLKNQERVVEMNAIINEAFRDWVAPIANALAIAIVNNLDVVEVGDQFFDGVLTETTEKFDDWLQYVRHRTTELTGSKE